MSCPTVIAEIPRMDFVNFPTGRPSGLFRLEMSRHLSLKILALVAYTGNDERFAVAAMAIENGCLIRENAFLTGKSQFYSLLLEMAQSK